MLCLCANVGFSTRAVLAKRLRQVHAQAHTLASQGGGQGGQGGGQGGGGGGASGDVRLFFEVSWRGAALLLPAAALLDGGALLHAPTGPDPNPNPHPHPNPNPNPNQVARCYTLPQASRGVHTPRASR